MPGAFERGVQLAMQGGAIPRGGTGELLTGAGQSLLGVWQEKIAKAQAEALEEKKMKREIEKAVKLERRKRELQRELPSLEEQRKAEYLKSLTGEPIEDEEFETTGYTATGFPIRKKKRPEEEELKRASELRKEFNASQTIKDYNTVNRGLKALESAYKASVSPDVKSRIASDQALGVLFQKLLDPQSVVRESEYARTPEGAAFFNRIESIGPQLVKGGLKLKDEDRFALVEMSRKLLSSSQEILNEHIERYRNLSKEYKIRPELVIGGVGEIKPQISPEISDDIRNQIQQQLPAGIKIKRIWKE